jgi:hypothetical protein
MMDFGTFKGDSDEPPKCHDDNDYTKPGKTDTTVQLVISMALGVTAFLSFCVSPQEVRD